MTDKNTAFEVPRGSLFFSTPPTTFKICENGVTKFPEVIQEVLEVVLAEILGVPEVVLILMFCSYGRRKSAGQTFFIFLLLIFVCCSDHIRVQEYRKTELVELDPKNIV